MFKEQLTYKAIKMLLAYTKISKEILFVNFGEANDFDTKCGIDYLDTIKANCSLIGVVFYKKYLEKEWFEQLMNIFIGKLNLRFIIYERYDEFNQFVDNKLKLDIQLAIDNWSHLEVITKDVVLNLQPFYQDKWHYWVITKRQLK